MPALAPVLDGSLNDAIARAVECLAQGDLVAFPTETVYGLGADATSDTAVARIFDAKARPSFNPLIIHGADQAALGPLIIWNDRAQRLADTFWPGPLSMVLEKSHDCPVSQLASAGLDTIAVRVPAHPVARTLLAGFSKPVAAPSANPSGEMSPTTAQHVMDRLGHAVALILDGGPSDVGLESTVIDISGANPILLRPGGITTEDLEDCLGEPVMTEPTDELRSPGMLARHYAPRTPVRLDTDRVEKDEVLIAFGANAPTTPYNLSPSGDLVEAAANFFAMMHLADAIGAGGIAVMPIPDTGIGRAINDRLRRAAAPV